MCPQLGRSTYKRLVPRKHRRVIAISAGNSLTCAVTTAEAVRCWGDNSAGQLGASPAFTSGPPPDGRLGVPYTRTFVATAVPSVTGYAASGPVPSGLTRDQANGVLSGTPTTPGTFAFDVTSTNEVNAESVHYAIHCCNCIRRSLVGIH